MADGPDASMRQRGDASGHCESTELRNRRQHQAAIAHLGQRALGDLPLDVSSTLDWLRTSYEV